ncbi:hypothetical protein PSFL111601_19885 [Pseudomonas floridensis]
MVARRGGHYATSRFLGRQLRQLVIGAANLEGEHRLLVFALEQHLIAEPLGQLPRALQRSFDGDVVDAGGEDFLDVLFKHRDDITDGKGKTGKSTPRSETRPYE